MKDRKIERRKDRKIEREKERKMEILKDQKIKRSKDQKINRLIYPSIDPAIYGRCQDNLIHKEGGQEDAPPKKLSLEEQVIAQATLAHIKEEAFMAKHRNLQVANNKLEQEKVQTTLELLKKQQNEAPRLPIQTPLVRTSEKRMYALHPPPPSPATIKAKEPSTNTGALTTYVP